MARTLIKSGIIVSMDPSIPDLDTGDLLIEGERIAAIAPNLTAAGAEVIDATNTIVMPGFVNAHIHAWQTALRGVAGDWTIPHYLNSMHGGLAPSFTPEDIHVSTLMGALNQLNAGTTTIVDWCHNNPTQEHTDAAIDGLTEAGIRALFLHGTPKPDPKPGEPHYSEVPHPRAEIERLMRDRFTVPEKLLSLGMAVLGPAYSTYEVSRADLEMAREFGLLCSMHVGGGAMRTPDGFARLLRDGLIDDRTNIVHGNNIGADQLRAMLFHGASVTVTPECELQMGFGDPLIGTLRALGAAPAIGTDVESAMGGDMFTNMRIALQHQRALDNAQIVAKSGQAPDRVSIPCREALEWATINGAKMIGRADRIGSLAPGKQADLVLLRADDLNVMPVVDPVATIVLHAGPANVDTVFVAGQAVKRHGKLAYPDLAKRKAALANTSRRILRSAGLLH